MKILLIRLVNKQFESLNVWPHLGLAYLATALRKEHSVEVLDCVNRKMGFDDLQKHLKRSNPDVIGLSLFYFDLEPAKIIIDMAKKINPQVLAVVGGPHVTGSPADILEYLKSADFAFRGEADRGLPILLRKINTGNSDFSQVPGLIWRKAQEVVINNMEFIDELDSLGMPSWDLMHLENYNLHPGPGIKLNNMYTFPIALSRGCPYRCAFCSNISGKKMRKRSIKNVIDEVKLLNEKHGAHALLLVDDNLAVDKEYLRQFCLEMERLNRGIKWVAFVGFRVDNLDEELVKLMERSGCYYINVGIESGSQRILDLMQKDLKVETISEKIALIKSNSRIKVGGFFIMGYPTETEADLRSTIRFSRGLRLDAALFYLFGLVPGSPIYYQLKQEHRLDDVDWSRFRVHASGRNYSEVSHFKLKLLYALAYLSFYLRPRIFFKTVSASAIRFGINVVFKSLRTAIFNFSVSKRKLLKVNQRLS